MENRWGEKMESGSRATGGKQSLVRFQEHGLRRRNIWEIDLLEMPTAWITEIAPKLCWPLNPFLAEDILAALWAQAPFCQDIYVPCELPTHISILKSFPSLLIDSLSPQLLLPAVPIIGNNFPNCSQKQMFSLWSHWTGLYCTIYMSTQH